MRGWYHLPPMRRGLFTLLSAMSLLLCVGTCALWARSYWVMDIVCWVHNERTSSQQGYVAEADGNFFDSVNGSFVFMKMELALPEHSGPLHWAHRDPPIPGTFTSPDATQIPFDFVAMATGILPLTWAIRHGIRRKRNRANICVGCGYDLRATPSRCPECGTAPAQTPCQSA
jgi:hypothetical protein